jgi:cation diffusion facilitator CzcD-associated flavoprotein CzcO
MDEPRVLIVGAGPAGLAAAGALAQLGVKALILERDSVGSSWRGRYDRLRLNSSRWTSKLPHSRYRRGTPLFPTREQVVRYLEEYAAQHGLEVRTGISVERLERDADGWKLETSAAGTFGAPQVIVATGFEHTPVIPGWPGRERYRGRLLHAADYRNAESFRGADVLVVGPGCSGMEIAYDLAEGGAMRVRLAVRTPPGIVLRAQGGLPGDPIAIAMLRLPPRIADAQMKVVRRLSVGDLAPFGLRAPDDGIFVRLHREGKAPAIVDKEVIEAIRDRRIEIVAGVEELEENGVRLAGGAHIEPDAVIAATGYRRALEGMAGHLGVLDERGVPRALGGEPAAPGLRFIGYVARPGQIGFMGVEAKRAAKAIAGELQRPETRTAAAMAGAA